MIYGGHTDTPARRDLALQVARASIVLLKNEERFLPLRKDRFKSLAVIGPNGNVARMHGGGSGALLGHYGVSPFLGIRNKVGDCVNVRYEPGILETRTELPAAGPDAFRLPNGTPGIYAEYFNNRDLPGEPVLTRSRNRSTSIGAMARDIRKVVPDRRNQALSVLIKWSARWTGTLVAPGSGWYEIGLKADNGIRLYLDGKKIIDAWTDARPAKFKTPGSNSKRDENTTLRIEFYENVGSCQCVLGMAPCLPARFWPMP